MNEKKRKTRIEFTPPNSKKIVVEETLGDNSVIKNINTSMSVQAFSTAKIEINPTPKHGDLLSIKSGDSVEVLMSEDEQPFSLLFSGFLQNVKVKSKEKSFELDLSVISHFYKLQLVNLNSGQFNPREGLKSIFTQILIIAEIDGTVEISDNISDTYVLDTFRNFPALSLINSICYELDLIYIFKEDNILELSKRRDVIEGMRNAKPIIELGPDQIISSEYEQ
ncbi:hypothetical protein [Fulvivirga ligni]|uniref:hypothetical protein n=1 Tax=Fulvivirga ligni TaxID=2904246 RepID=UPI001F1C7B8F|nr:hypothetical protein [Fulvivirga ligni]UII20471.1 hypothetical protein LVD16_21775 [Fulvivirga ligni]